MMNRSGNGGWALEDHWPIMIYGNNSGQVELGDSVSIQWTPPTGGWRGMREQTAMSTQ